MIDIIGITLFSLAIVFGVRISTSEGMVFEKIGEYANSKLENGHKIWEALVLCPYCLPSIWSLAGYVVYFLVYPESSLRLLFAYPVIVGLTSLLSGLTWSIFELLWIKKKYYEQAEEKIHIDIKNLKQEYHNKKNKKWQQLRRLLLKSLPQNQKHLPRKKVLHCHLWLTIIHHFR